MDRRGFIALLAPLTAGCFGGTAVSRRGEETPTATPSNATATPEPTATPTPEPTATPEPTPTVNQQRAARRLRTARERVGRAVKAYAGGGTVADVRADTEEFDAREVYVRLVEASGAVSRAAEAAVTDEQTRATAALEGTVGFLSEATAGQAAVIGGYDALVEAHAELKAGAADSARDTVDVLDGRRDEVERAVMRIERETERSDLEAVAAVEADARSAKLEQFRAAATALDETGRPVGALADAIRVLDDAREAAADGNSNNAVDLGEEAKQELSDLADELDAIREDLPDVAAPFADVIEKLGTLASEEASAAGDIVAQNK